MKSGHGQDLDHRFPRGRWASTSGAGPSVGRWPEGAESDRFGDAGPSHDGGEQSLRVGRGGGRLLGVRSTCGPSSSRPGRRAGPVVLVEPRVERVRDAGRDSFPALQVRASLASRTAWTSSTRSSSRHHPAPTRRSPCTRHGGGEARPRREAARHQSPGCTADGEPCPRSAASCRRSGTRSSITRRSGRFKGDGRERRPGRPLLPGHSATQLGLYQHDVTCCGTSRHTTCRSELRRGRPADSVECWGARHAHRRLEDIAHVRVCYDEPQSRRRST